MRAALRLRLGACLAATALAVALAAQAAVPPGYRYVGSRVVSEGRVVYWYWYVDHMEPTPDGAAFVARMFARSPDVGRERPYVATIRCDTRKYRELGARGAYESIDDGEPVDAVWRAGCRDGVAVSLAERNARLGGVPGGAAPADTTAAVPLRAATPPPASPPLAPSAASPAPGVAAPKPAPTPTGDPRRVDACVRFAEIAPAPGGDATITNTCGFAVEVTVCYKGAGGGMFDCGTPPRGRRADSLAPGATHVLPEYRRGRNTGIAAVACRGSIGSVFPRLGDGDRTGCF